MIFMIIGPFPCTNLILMTVETLDIGGSLTWPIFLYFQLAPSAFLLVKLI